MTKYIELTQGFVALVDDEDYENLVSWDWHYNGGYAVTSHNKKHPRLFMHRYIVSTPKGMDTDHINGNKLDNRKSNLRVCNKSQNAANKKVQNNTSGYKGVYYRKSRNTFSARIKLKGVVFNLGIYNNPIDAAKAYNDAAIRYFGKFAKLNEIKE